MWLRSQDKTFLLKVTGVYESNSRLFALPEPQDYEIGKFSDRAEALAELDRIEKWLNMGFGVYQVSQP